MDGFDFNKLGMCRFKYKNWIENNFSNYYKAKYIRHIHKKNFWISKELYISEYIEGLWRQRIFLLLHMKSLKN